MHNNQEKAPAYANGWQEWSKFVLKELERFNDNFDDLDKKINENYKSLDNSIRELQVKSAESRIVTVILGAVGGLILSIIGGIIINFINK